MFARARRRWWLGTAVALTALVSVCMTATRLMGASATATEPLSGFDPYLHRADSTIADPINLIFRGADADGVAAAIQQVLGWRVVTGSAMTFLDQGQSHPTRWQLGLDLGGGSRLHVRVEGGTPNDPRGYVLAAVHRDDSVSCGHVGRAFDETRDFVAQAFAAAGYTVTYVRLDNIESATHCNGTHNAGDGNAVIVELDAR